MNIVPFPAPGLPAAYTSDFPVIGLDATDSIALGRFFDPQRGIRGKLMYGGGLNVLVIGGNGRGKGTRILMPNLLQMSGSSVVVIDPKGELAAVTAPWRARLGPVVVINPFGLHTSIPGYQDLRSSGFNPLASLDPSLPSFNVDVSLLAEAMITRQSKEPHWDDSARALVSVLIMHTVIEARQSGQIPTIARVRELLCQASAAPDSTNNYEGVGIPKLALEMMNSPVPGLRNKAAQFLNWSKEVQSIVSTAMRQTEAFDDPEISGDMARNGLDFAELKRQPITVYLVLPPHMMNRHAKWLRLIITSAMNAVLRPREAFGPRVLFMLDEFFALGHLEIVQTAWALVRGYGVQIMPVLQDLHQLKTLYKDMWESFLSNAGATLAFSPNDPTTAEWLSKRAGETTKMSKSTTFNSAQSETSAPNYGLSTNTSFGSSLGEVRAPLITPHRLMGLNEGFTIAMISGLSNVVPCYAPAYYEIDQCRDRKRRNPYVRGS